MKGNKIKPHVPAFILFLFIYFSLSLFQLSLFHFFRVYFIFVALYVFLRIGKINKMLMTHLQRVEEFFSIRVTTKVVFVKLPDAFVPQPGGRLTLHGVGQVERTRGSQ